MTFTINKELLEKQGYLIVENVLTPEEVETAKAAFYEWKKTIPNLDHFHKTCNPHGIFKCHEVGHQWFAWYIRTRPSVRKVFEELWDTDELVTGFDGSGHIPKLWVKKDNCWTHTDQAPDKKGLYCYQSLVALTTNSERTLVVYEGSNNLHEKYCKEKGLKGTKNWAKIDPAYLETMKDKRRILTIPAGAMAIWDSRTFHQNQYGKPASEERIVQYVCMLPKASPLNTEAIKKKRRKYFEERRTTSHWPYPMIVNGKQPQTYGDTSKRINYDSLAKPNLADLMTEIEKLL